jgi:hypothetical protein
MSKSPRIPLLNLPLPLTGTGSGSSTGTPANPASPRTRSASLSIARSPLLSPSSSTSTPAPALHTRGLSYTSVPSPFGKTPEEDGEGYDGYGYDNAYTRDADRDRDHLSPRKYTHVTPVRAHASDTDDTEEHGELLHRRSRKLPPANPHSRGPSRASFEIGIDDSLEMQALERDIEALDSDLAVHPAGAGLGQAGGADYAGPFQPPTGREATGIAVSIAAVAMLAVVAGLTTVYDWVL